MFPCCVDNIPTGGLAKFRTNILNYKRHRHAVNESMDRYR